MGASISVSQAEKNNRIVSDQLQQCPPTSCTNVSEGNTYNIGDTGGGSINLSQKCAVDVSCVSNSLASTLANNLNQLAADAKAALGFGFAVNRSVTTQDVQQRQMQRCGVVSLENISKNNTYNISRTGGGSIDISQGASADVNCIFAGLAEDISKTEVKANSMSSGLNPASILALLASPLLIGGSAIALIIILIIWRILR